MTIEEARKKIVKAIDQNGPYSHNICGMVLSAVAGTAGYGVANSLIKEYALEELFGIKPVSEAK